MVNAYQYGTAALVRDAIPQPQTAVPTIANVTQPVRPRVVKRETISFPWFLPP